MVKNVKNGKKSKFFLIHKSSGDIVGFSSIDRTGKKVWARCRITEIAAQDSDPLFDLQMIDFGDCVKEVKPNKLRSLEEKHKKVVPLAYRCHMHNLVPAGFTNTLATDR